MAAELTLRATQFGFLNAPTVSDPVVHHVHPRNYFFRSYDPGGEFGGHLIRYDGEGRRVDLSPTGAAGAREARLALVGDSFVEAVQVPYEKSIAGLLQTRSAQNIQQIPWLGSVPVLGALFRSSAYQQNETDLVIVVTPRLVAPLVPGQRIATPMDQRLPANDIDLFLNGQMEVRKRYNDSVTPGGEAKGPYGHMIAREPPEPIVSTKN